MPKPNWGGAGTGALSGAAAGSAFGPVGAGIGGLIGGGLGLFSGGGQGHQMPKISQQSLLGPEQRPLYQQAINAGMNPGAGGAFGQAADYYRSNLSDNPADFNAFAAPALRQYYQDIVPNLSEQFAQGGGGQGSFGSSGFRNAQIQGATDLSERLGALRAQLRQNSAQGLQNIGQIGLGSFHENIYPENQPTGLESLVQGAGKILPSLASGFFSGNKVGANTDPYQGGGGASSPQVRSFGSPGSGSFLPSPRLGR